MLKVFGSRNERILKGVHPLVEEITSLEPAMKKLSADELRAKTDEFKKQLASGKTVDDILPEAFAVVREASVRTINMRHYDCQLVGGIVLHRGMIAEMATGEGKTLAATLPLYLNALTGRGCHLVTVNDYLARRDPWMSLPKWNLKLRLQSVTATSESIPIGRAAPADNTSTRPTVPCALRICRRESSCSARASGRSFAIARTR